MACRILRAPAVAQSMYRAVPDLNLGVLNTAFRGARRSEQPNKIQTRGYNNYKTHGEMAALKDPADGTVFTEEPEYPEVIRFTLWLKC